MATIQKTPDKALRKFVSAPCRFFAIHRRRAIGWAVAFAIEGAYIALMAARQDLSSLVAFLRSDAFEFSGNMIVTLLLTEALPIFLLVAIAILLGAAVGAFLCLVLQALIPRRFTNILDAAALGVLSVLPLQASGLNDALDATGFPGLSLFVFMWLAYTLLGDAVWRHLPFGFNLNDQATIATDATPDKIFASLARGHDAPDLAVGETRTVQTVNQVNCTLHYRDHNHITSTEDYGYRQVRLELTAKQAADGRTQLHCRARFTHLSPLSWWDFWARPFARDYCEHIAARAACATDKSINGRLFDKITRKLERKAARSAGRTA